MMKGSWSGFSARFEARTRLSALGSFTLATLALWMLCMAAAQSRGQTPQSKNDRPRPNEKPRIGGAG